MTMQEANDPSAFRDFELGGWNISAGDYEGAFSPLTRQTIGAFLEVAGELKGIDALDVCCGPGDLTVELARGGARAVGVDFSSEMVRIATERHGSVAKFQDGDAENLPFEEQSFDLVTMNYGILHLAKPGVAISEAARVLRPGGRFAFSCWLGPDSARGFGAILDAVRDSEVTPSGVPHGPDFFYFSNPENCRSALTESGFTDIEVVPVTQIWNLESGGALFDAFLNGTARTGGMLRSLSGSDRAKARELAIRYAEERFGRPLSIPMPAHVASGLSR